MHHNTLHHNCCVTCVSVFAFDFSVRGSYGNTEKLAALACRISERPCRLAVCAAEYAPDAKCSGKLKPSNVMASCIGIHLCLRLAFMPTVKLVIAFTVTVDMLQDRAQTNNHSVWLFRKRKLEKNPFAPFTRPPSPLGLAGLLWGSKGALALSSNPCWQQVHFSRIATCTLGCLLLPTSAIKQLAM